MGIDAEHLEHVFEMFAQLLPSLTHSRGGLGLGLTLVRSLVEMHGGTVEARSGCAGQGTELVVRLPMLAEVPALPTKQSESQPAVLVSQRILVVDDNVDAADSLAMLLQVSGHEVHIAHDGLRAVESAAELQPDVVLLDLGLPGINGHEVARRIRAQRDDGVLLIAITGRGQDEDRRRTKEQDLMSTWPNRSITPI